MILTYHFFKFPVSRQCKVHCGALWCFKSVIQLVPRGSCCHCSPQWQSLAPRLSCRGSVHPWHSDTDLTSKQVDCTLNGQISHIMSNMLLIFLVWGCFWLLALLIHTWTNLKVLSCINGILWLYRITLFIVSHLIYISGC